MTFPASRVPQGGKMVATLRTDLDLDPEGTVQIEAWCSKF